MSRPVAGPLPPEASVTGRSFLSRANGLSDPARNLHAGYPKQIREGTLSPVCPRNQRKEQDQDPS